jgi:hypothetical protein
MSAPDDRSTTADRLRRDVEVLCAARDRRVGSPGHDAARAYLTERYAAIGLRPYGDAFELPYADGGLHFTNLVAVAPARDASAIDAAPLLLAAHYDTVADSPGADDNAAAIAITLEVARRLVARPATRPVVIAQFDAEEPPYFHSGVMGSTYFNARQARTPFHAAIVLDLVGHDVPIPGVEDVVFMTGMESDPALERTVTELGRIDGLRLVTALNRYVGDMSDHHTFRLGQVPYLFLSCGRWPHYHAPTDTADRVAWPKCAAMADLVEALTRDVAARTLAGPWEGYDTTATDIATMRAALGPLLDGLGIELRSRSDIDRVVALLLQRTML